MFALYTTTWHCILKHEEGLNVKAMQFLSLMIDEISCISVKMNKNLKILKGE